ncbi:hypothetical protein LOS20_15820 [Enterococcus faecium]|nr:hypothetical protein [Enterococcus faecium]
MQKHFFDQIERLNEKEIAVYLTFGNHDYYQSERYWFYFSRKCSFIYFGSGRNKDIFI